MDYNYNGSFHYQGGGDFDRWDSFSLDDEKRARGKFSRVLLAITVMLLVATVIANATVIIIHLAGGDSAALVDDGAFQLILSSVCTYVLAFPVFLLMTRKMYYVPRIKRRMSGRDFFFFLAVSVGIMYVGSIIGNLLSEFFGLFLGGTSDNSVAELIEKTPLPLTIAIVVIIGPIFEELVFRKLLMDKLSPYGDRIAIIVSAVTFSLFHGNLYQMFYAFGIGLILAYVYSKWGNVLHTILLHAILNFWGSAIPMLLMPHLEKLEEILPELEAGSSEVMMEHAPSIMLLGTYSMVQFGLVFFGLFLLFRHRKSFFVSDRCEVYIPKEKRSRVIVANVGAIVFIVYTCATVILNLLTPLLTGAGA
ncbi:MAG: CPBP family intramembrane metalloprotease [Clostridia bacterium]|nr:CPBP family intramembrane metalloprotease [Clostridia bacterium]